MNKRIPISFIFLLLIAGCTADLNQGSNSASRVSAKMVNTKSEASDPYSVLVKLTCPLNDETLVALKAAGAGSVTPVFSSVAGKEALEHKFGLDRWYKVGISENDVDKLASSLSLVEEVSAIEYDNKATKASDCIVYPYDGDPLPSADTKSTATTFNDPYLTDQWNFNNQGNASIATTAYKGADINIKDVWGSLTTGDTSIIVAVVDEGVKYNHPDLQGNMWVNSKEYNGKEGVDDDGNGYIDDIYGYNFVSDGPITFSKSGDSGHGTHCAGVISAVNNNNVGISSVAGGSGNNDGVRIMSCQVFDGKSGGDSYTIAKAVKYAADMGASIISCSFGYKGGAYLSDGSYSSANGVEIDAIHYFEATKNNDVVDGGIAIFAAGNDGDPYATYPGAMSDIISVSAFGPDYLPTYYTNYGPGCNIVAPGGEAYLAPWTTHKALILSTVPYELYNDNYGYMQGTSMACPHVSGITALGLSYAKKLGKTFTVKKFKELVVTSANDFDTHMVGTKEYYNNAEPALQLKNYMKKMGTGSIDTWLLMMKIEGVPCLLASTAGKQWLDISPYFGTSSVNLTYTGIEMTDAAKAAIGLSEDPYIQYGRLYINPTKIGSAKLTIHAIGGGTQLGGEDNIGGMAISQEVSIIVRSFKSTNGGWL